MFQPPETLTLAPTPRTLIAIWWNNGPNAKPSDRPITRPLPPTHLSSGLRLVGGTPITAKFVIPEETSLGAALAAFHATTPFPIRGRDRQTNPCSPSPASSVIPRSATRRKEPTGKVGCPRGGHPDPTRHNGIRVLPDSKPGPPRRRWRRSGARKPRASEADTAATTGASKGTGAADASATDAHAKPQRVTARRPYPATRKGTPAVLRVIVLIQQKVTLRREGFQSPDRTFDVKPANRSGEGMRSSTKGRKYSRTSTLQYYVYIYIY